MYSLQSEKSKKGEKKPVSPNTNSGESERYVQKMCAVVSQGLTN